MTKSEEYNVNFFRPLTDHARANKRLITTLAVVWFIGVFGFQVLLMVLNKPTPEPAYTTFESVWSDVATNPDTTVENRQKFARSVLHVLGKNVAVKKDHNSILKEGLSWSVYTMLPESSRQVFHHAVLEKAAFNAAAEVIGLESSGFDKIMIDLLPFSLIQMSSTKLNADVRDTLPEIMELYLVHNQSVLTDFNFIGFPFHYWYTAQFLLIMFVVLCLIYAVITDRSNKKFNMDDEN